MTHAAVPEGPRLEGPRVVLQPASAPDADALHEAWTHPDVRRFLWDDGVIPRATTEEIVARSVALFAAQGFGMWVVRERGRPELAGFAGLWHFRTPPELELLFGLARHAWGRGLATEAAALVLDYAHQGLGMAEVVGSTDAANVSSIRVMERLGMHRTRESTVDGLPTVFFVHRAVSR